MTVTLSPGLAGLLDRTGHTWPAADEDRIVAMAEGWRALGVRLDLVRDDHLDARRSVTAAGHGEGVAAFGDWTAGIHEWLLQLVEVCARVEAWLMSVARTVTEAKTAIVDALDALARRIEEAERDLADVPIIGDALAAPVEAIEPLFTQVRTTITEILDRVSELAVDQVVPGLVGAIEWVKSIVQGLRKLLRWEIGADWPTTPAGAPDPRNRPRGPLAKPDPNDHDPVNHRSLRLENEAAATLARAGYDVEQIAWKPPLRTPDYLINGKRFDCYSPTTPRARNIWDLIQRDKVRRNQTDRVIIDIDAPDARADVGDLRRQFQDHPIPGLQEVKVIGPGGAIIDIFP